MSLAEIIECTRWGRRQVVRALSHLLDVEACRVAHRKFGDRVRKYEAVK